MLPQCGECPFAEWTKRTSSDYLTHQDNGWLSTGCLAADIVRAGGTGIDKILYANDPAATETLNIAQAIEVEETALREGEYANRVTVVGADNRGYPRWWRWEHPSAIAPDATLDTQYVGWPISKVERDEGLESISSVYRRSVDLDGKLYGRHTVLRSVKGSWITDLFPGMVIQVYGAARQGADGKNYRVLGVKPNPRDMATTIMAREMV